MYIFLYYSIIFTINIFFKFIKQYPKIFIKRTHYFTLNHNNNNNNRKKNNLLLLSLLLYLWQYIFLLYTPYSDNDHWRMVAHACCHIRLEPTARIQLYGRSNGSDSLCRNTLSLPSHFLSPPLQPCPAWSGPPYIWQRLFVYALLSLSLFLYCAFQTQKSSLGSQSESDRPQKRAFTSLHTFTCLWLLRSYFLIFLLLRFVQFPSWRSRRTCYPWSCCFVPIGFHLWFLGLLDVFLFWVFLLSLFWWGSEVCREHVVLHGSLWRGFGVGLIFGKLGFLFCCVCVWAWSALASGRSGTWGNAIMIITIIIILMGLGKLRMLALS